MFEYKVVDYRGDRSEKTFTEILNNHAKDNWRLVSHLIHGGDAEMIFERDVVVEENVPEKINPVHKELLQYQNPLSKPFPYGYGTELPEAGPPAEPVKSKPVVRRTEMQKKGK